MAAVAAVSKEAEIEVWPENWQAFSIFERLRTQWTVGFGGPTGLRYESVYPLLNRMQLCDADWELMLDDIRVMEYAVLQQISGDGS